MREGKRERVNVIYASFSLYNVDLNLVFRVTGQGEGQGALLSQLCRESERNDQRERETERESQ